MFVTGVHQGARAGVPAEVVQLVPGRRQVDPADDLGVVVRRLVDVDHAEGIGAFAGPVEGDDVRELLARRSDGFGGAAVERRVHRGGGVVLRAG
jgi:hypothetical protein